MLADTSLRTETHLDISLCVYDICSMHAEKRKNNVGQIMNSASVRNVATEARRRAILQAALAAYTTKGFTDMTMEDVRVLSGASTGSIYHHFENKEKLALALYLEGREDLYIHLRAAIEVKQPQVGIKTLVHAYINWFEHNPELGQYLLQAGSAEYLADQVKSLRKSPDAFQIQFKQWLDLFIAAGLVKDFPPQVYFPLIIGPSKEFVRRWLLTARNIAELEAARQVLSEAAWMVIATS
jgi:AcrR family transcriptional regulator